MEIKSQFMYYLYKFKCDIVGGDLFLYFQWTVTNEELLTEFKLQFFYGY